MLKRALPFLILPLLTCGSVAFAQSGFERAFKNGKTKGTLRLYRNDRHFPSAQDTGTTSLGGSLHYETDPAEPLRFGMTFYSANNMGIDSDDASKVNPMLPADNVDILGEAYLQLNLMGTVLTGGRQLFVSPFANPSDAFIIPITFSGYSLVSHSFDHFVIRLAQLNQIKNRQSDEFVDTGLFITQRYLGQNKGQSTSGTTVADVQWSDHGLTAEGAGYHFTDIFDMLFLQLGYSWDHWQPVQPYISAQYVTQGGDGAKLLGSVSSQLYGAKLGAKWGRADLSVAYTSSPVSTKSYLNGGALAPFTFYTDPIFTNSMLTGPTNVEAGDAFKAMVNYGITKRFHVKLSHSNLWFKNYKHVSGGVNLSETDLWFAYAFAGSMKGFSLQLRMAKVEAEQAAKSVTEIRSQLQYVF